MPTIACERSLLIENGLYYSIGVGGLVGLAAGAWQATLTGPTGSRTWTCEAALVRTSCDEDGSGTFTRGQTVHLTVNGVTAFGEWSFGLSTYT
jgi:hypothetical protein